MREISVMVLFTHISKILAQIKPYFVKNRTSHNDLIHRFIKNEILQVAKA